MDSETRRYMVTKEQENMRLDKTITLLDIELSRMEAQRLIEEGKILVNGKKEKVSYKVKEGNSIVVKKDPPKEIGIKAQKIPIEIIYEDEDIIVVNKPKGMVVHPGDGNPDRTLVNAIMAIAKDTLSGIGGELRPGIIHRLDKDTSGILIVAKNDKAHINISNQIKDRETKKIYLALVRGVVKENDATINMPIERSTKNRKKMAVNKKGKEAITHFKVLNRYQGYTLLEVKIDTGRTHQIRVHLAQIGYPIVGDYVYSNGKNPFGIIGQCLHAKSIEFIHPRTKERMHLEAPLPQYFEEVLQQLKNKEI